MSDPALSTLSIWLIAISLVAFIGAVIVQRRLSAKALGTEDRQAQLNQLDTVARETGNDELVLDWLQFRVLEKGKLAGALAARGWDYHSQEITDRSWLLKFTRSRETR